MPRGVAETSTRGCDANHASLELAPEDLDAIAAAIEARVIAWLANEQWALDAFARGRDIYVETAERMGGLTRKEGKVAVLALGYNGGQRSLEAMLL